MDLNKEMRLTQGDKEIYLPLCNLLRITLVYLVKLLPEYYEDPEHKSNSIDEFIKWSFKKLGVKKGEAILL